MKYYLELEEHQKEELLKLVDLNLRANGIQALHQSVELYNVLNSAKPETEYELKELPTESDFAKAITSAEKVLNEGKVLNK